jgi:hypothetical protein
VRTVFIRALEAEDKAAALRDTIDGVANGLRFDVAPSEFGAVPKSPFAYWVSSRVRSLFQTFPSFEGEGRTAKQGLATADDFRFVRASWEPVLTSVGSRWFPFAKGGAFSPFYADHALLVGYSRGDQVGLMAIGRYGRGADFYHHPGLTWPRRTNGLSLRAMPAGCIFADKGPAAFVEADAPADLLALAAIANSRAFSLLVSLQLARTELAQSYEVGLIQMTPVPRLTVDDAEALSNLARQAWSLKRALDTHIETSHAFVLPAALQVDRSSIAAAASAWAERVRATEGTVGTLEAKIDERCFDLYGIDDADRRAFAKGFTSTGTSSEGDADGDDGDDDDGDGDNAEALGDPARVARELVAWTIGVAVGRFDVRLATGDRALPPVPEPFDPLPACAPGALTGGDRLPLPRPPAGYPVSFPETGILVDEVGHPRDLTAAVRAVFDIVFGAQADAMWAEGSALLSPKTHDLRAWLANEFFEHHLKRYSKSRRKAPIYWPLSTASGRYTVWLYAHRLTSDSLLLVQNDLLAPKLALEERKLAGLTGESAQDRSERGRQQDFVDELRAMRDELARVAPLFRPTLDDGIVLVCAPLWRLFRHRPWQKELHSKWDELAEGKYDWAQIAMHLWPERVVPKCAEDRSLAIAHGLEDVFWVEDSAGKWQKRPTPTKPVAALVAERTSAAVKAALKSLIDAPAAAPAGRKARRGKADA